MRVVALIAALCGAVGSVASMLSAGRHNNSRFLLFLFAVWVVSPFIALIWAGLVSKVWRVLTRATLYSAMLVVAPLSLTVYRYVALAHNAAIFVVVPPLSLVLTAAVVGTAALLSGRRLGPGDG